MRPVVNALATSRPRPKRRSWALLATVALVAGLLAPLTVATPAQAALTTVGPVDPANGYPKWFGDQDGLRLEACLDPADPLCLQPLAPPFNPNNGPVSFPDNFPEEAFYWTGDAEITAPGVNAL